MLMVWFVFWLGLLLGFDVVGGMLLVAFVALFLVCMLLLFGIRFG